MELEDGGEPRLLEPGVLGNFTPAESSKPLPPVATLPEATTWLNENALTSFLNEVREERLSEVERIASVLVLPHPEREAPDVKRLRQDTETEKIAMEVVMEHEKAQNRQVYDVHEKHLGYDITSLDLNSGELRLIEVKGIGDITGTVLLTPNERRVAEDRRDCYWLYVVTSCNSKCQLQEPIKDPARFPWHEVKKVEHYYLSVDALTQPMRVSERPESYRKG